MQDFIGSISTKMTQEDCLVCPNLDPDICKQCLFGEARRLAEMREKIFIEIEGVAMSSLIEKAKELGYYGDVGKMLESIADGSIELVARNDRVEIGSTTDKTIDRVQDILFG